MSHTETFLRPGGTIPELMGLLNMSNEEKRYLNEVLKGYGSKAHKGFDFGIASLGILASRRTPQINPKTNEHIPFKFRIDNDSDGKFRGFNLGLSTLSALLNVEYEPVQLSDLGDDEVLVAEHIDSDLVMVGNIIASSENDRVDLELPGRTIHIAAFTIMHADGMPLGEEISLL